MGRRPSWLRILAGALIITQGHACAPVWKNTGRVSPRDVVREWQPDTVRIWIAEGAVEVAAPRVIGDSLVGAVQMRGRQERVSYARLHVGAVQWHGSRVRVELPSGDTVELRDAWWTPDSVGGQRVVAPSSARRAFALYEIGELQVKAIPSTTDRAGGVVTVVPGERVRVRYPDRGRQATSEGMLGALEEDTLTVILDNGRTARIPLAGVTRIDVRTGTRSNALSGLMVGGIGAAVIMGLGAVLYAMEGEDSAGSGCCGAAIILWGAGVVGLGFLVIASTVGVATRSDRWETVQLEALRGIRAR